MKLVVAVMAALVLTASSEAQLGWIERCLPYGTFAQEIRPIYNEEPSPLVRITKVAFVNSNHLPATIRQQAKARLKESDSYGTEKWLDYAKELIVDTWQQHGYMKVRVETEGSIVRRSIEQVDTVISASVDAGPQYRLGTITFTRGTQFDNKTVRKEFPLKEGELFNVERFRTGLERLRMLYGLRGFINFTAIPDLLYDEEQRTIHVTIELDEGRQYLIGEVRILGLSPEEEALVRSESALQPGTIYRADLVGEVILAKPSQRVASLPNLSDYTLQQTRDGRIFITLDFRRCPEYQGR